MAFAKKDGTRITKSNIPTTTVTSETVYQLTEDVYRSFTHPGGKFERSSLLALVKGQKITQTQLDALFATATFTSITPATGLAAGGLAVTITGTNFAGTNGVTFGGTAATNVKVVSETTITCTTPAKTAGAYVVAIADDSGTISSPAGAFTYS